MKHQLHKDFSDTGVVAIIIPVYHGGTKISACLESIAHLDCNFGQLKVIVVDDCSNDGTTDAVRVVFNRLRSVGIRRLLLVRQSTRRGAPAAFNGGLTDVPDSVRWIWKLDADVQAAPNALSALLQRATEDEREKIGAVSSRVVTPTGEAETVASVFGVQQMCDAYGQLYENQIRQ